MLVFALMIGVVSDSIGARVDELKRGSAKVRARLRPPCAPLRQFDSPRAAIVTTLASFQPPSCYVMTPLTP